MRKTKKQSFLLYYDIREPLGLLSDEERGKLFTAILDYAEKDIIPEFKGALAMAFAFLKESVDRDSRKWDETRESRADAGRKGGLAKQANATFAKQNKQSVANVANVAVPVPVPVPDNVPVPVPAQNDSKKESLSRENGDADKPPISRFVPPTVEEVSAYCHEKGYRYVNPERFVAFYGSKGWMVGRNKMKSWKQAVSHWEYGERDKHKETDISSTRKYECTEGESL